jgi:autophagy-related protein 9
MSHPFASHYIDQFPKVKTEMVARTVSFIAGALATVLAVATVVDPELFLGFEITPDRTVLFYTAIFGSVWAFARGSMSEENSVFDPEYAMRNVIEYTHYEPDHWKERLHGFDIKQEFAELYKIKIVIFLEEILSILTTPFVLFYSLPKASDQIIDFFREFTIHVDGLGYVCSFAEFDFKKGIGKGKRNDGGDVRDDYYAAKHGKMEASYYGFMGNYGNFVLNPKTGAPSHLPPGTRNQFHPPPAWPSMGSPPPVADLQASRTGGRGERVISRTTTKNPRHVPGLPQPSPMASILLDPHHQPPNTTHNGRPTHPPRQQRGGHPGQSYILEEALEDDGEVSDVGPRHDEEAYESGGGLMDESAWQTSPARTISRENSAADGRGAPDAGVVRMIYQFNQAQLNRRPGGVR